MISKAHIWIAAALIAAAVPCGAHTTALRDAVPVKLEKKASGKKLTGAKDLRPLGILRDDVPMRPEMRPPKRKLKGAADAPSIKPPLAKSQVQLRIDYNLLKPERRADIEDLADEVSSRPENALLKALLGFAAPQGSKEIRTSGCCMRLRYGGCVYFCCGSRESSCQDSCELQYCETK